MRNKKKVIIGVLLFVCIGALLYFFIFTGGFRSSTNSKDTMDYAAKTETQDNIESEITKGLSKELTAAMSDIRVSIDSNNAVNVTVRVIRTGGAYIPMAADEISPIVLKILDEKSLSLGSMNIWEYAESNANGIDDSTIISWRTTDCVSGMFADATNPSTTLSKKTIDELYTYFDLTRNSKK